MSVAEYETLGARFFGLIFKDSTVYPAVRERARELGYACTMLSEYMEAEAAEAALKAARSPQERRKARADLDRAKNRLRVAETTE